MAIRRVYQHYRQHGIRRTGEKVISYLPKTVPPTGVPLYYRYRALKNWKKSAGQGERPDPLKIVWISPERIKYNSKKRFSYLDDMYADIGLIAGGDWDQSDERFGETTIFDSERPQATVYKAIKQHFEQGVQWEETEFIQHVLERVQAGKKGWHGATSKTDVMERCDHLDNLYKFIKENGYKSKRQLFEQSEDHMRRVPKLNPMRFYYLYDEIVCNISRNGDFLFVGGHHRLSIAKILGINVIPVRIFVRHRELVLSN